MYALYGHPRPFQVQAKISTVRPVLPDYLSVSYDYGLMRIYSLLAGGTDQIYIFSCIRQKWMNDIDLLCKLFLRYGGNVNIWQSIHHPFSVCLQEKGILWQLSKQIVFLLNKCLSILSSWPNWRGEECFSLENQGGETQREITPKITWLL